MSVSSDGGRGEDLALIARIADGDRVALGDALPPPRRLADRPPPVASAATPT